MIPVLTVSGKTYQPKLLTIGDWLTIAKFEDNKTLLSPSDRMERELEILGDIFDVDKDLLMEMPMDEPWALYDQCMDYLIDVWASKLPKTVVSKEEVTPKTE